MSTKNELELEQKISALVHFAVMGWKKQVIDEHFWPSFARCIGQLGETAEAEAKEIFMRLVAVYELRTGSYSENGDQIDPPNPK